MKTPLLLIAWRRPHTLRQVIDAIRPVAPTHLFVACDGPNSDRPGEADKVAETRQLIEEAIDWPCQIERFYSDVNQGCRLGVSRAISWFFEQVEEGIILEDDCIPHPSFFPFCSEMLSFYRNDSRIWAVSGNNFQNGQWRGDGSYYFSKYKHCWGWATWRRCWEKYDSELLNWPAVLGGGYLESMFTDPVERNHWYAIWKRLFEDGQPDTWDYQWSLTCFSNSGLTILPNQNLVNNIGFDADSTHTNWGKPDPGTATWFVVKETSKTQEIEFPLKHPSLVLQSWDADRHDFLNVIRGSSDSNSAFLYKKYLRRIKRLLSHVRSFPISRP